MHFLECALRRNAELTRQEIPFGSSIRPDSICLGRKMARIFCKSLDPNLGIVQSRGLFVQFMKVLISH
jgi:hypothetical protein